MRINLRRLVLVGLVALGGMSSARAFVYFADSKVLWQPGAIPMQIKLGTGAGALQDGSNYSTSVEAAMTAWNAQLGTVQFAPSIVAESSATDPSHTVSEIVFSDSIEGTAFGDNVLAVTLSYSSTSVHQVLASDVFFNTAYTWRSYRGNLQFDASNKLLPDIRRVALHELGHVLGLGHPDTQGQSVAALMNSRVSNLDSLAADDIAGAQSLYLAPGYTTSPSNDAFANAAPINVTNGYGFAEGTSYYATKQAGEPNHAGTIGGKSVWWKWIAPSSGSAVISTQGSLFDTVLAVYRGSSVNALTSIAANDDAPRSSHVQYSEVTFDVVAGVSYLIAVDGWFTSTTGLTPSGLIALTINFSLPAAPPIFTSQPVDVTVVSGQAATFSVAVSGSPAPTLQWRKDGVPLPGETSLSYVIAAATAANGGTYTVVATNNVGIVESAAAKLNVLSADAAADFNGDGKPDLVWSNSVSGERAIWLMNGTNFLGSSTLGVFPLEWTVAATGDFNGDGKTDLVWSNRITGERAIWLMNGTSLLASSTLGVFPLEWTVAATADFNRDGKPDIIWSNSVTGERAIWLMNGTSFLAASTLGVFPLEWTVAATGDFNRDGKPDIIWSNSVTGERAIWLMNGTSFLAASTLGIFPLEWTVRGAADFNSDGKPDIIWSNNVTGERALWLMNGTNFLASSTLGVFPLEWSVGN